MDRKNGKQINPDEKEKLTATDHPDVPGTADANARPVRRTRTKKRTDAPETAEAQAAESADATEKGPEAAETEEAAAAAENPRDGGAPAGADAESAGAEDTETVEDGACETDGAAETETDSGDGAEASGKKVKKTKKVRYGKIPRMFRRKYSERKFARRISKPLRIPSDRKFVEGLFERKEVRRGKKTKVFLAVPNPKQISASSCKRLKKLAKAIKKQDKSRLKLANVAVVLAVFFGVLFVLGLFRNVIARKVLTSAMEGIFGAKCDIALVDFNILNTRFTVEGMEVADKDEPMKNLFEIGRFDLYFNLLELTRGKLVSENIELTGINWGTDRETSGELPESRRKKIEEKKESSSFNFKETAASVATKLHADQGFAAVLDRYNPQKILEAEIAALQTPAVLESLKTEVPELVEKWQDQYDSVIEMTRTTASDITTISAINPSELKTAEDVARLIATMKEISERTKKTVESSKSLAESLQADIATVQTLGSSAAAAVKNDSAHLMAIADEIADFNMDSAQNLVSGIFETFLRGMLGEYYPYVQRGITAIQQMQDAKNKEKAEEDRKLSLEQRASLLERLPGKTLAFGASAPNLWLKNIALSCEGGNTGFSGGGRVTNITSDADMLSEPSRVTLSFAKDALKTLADGVIDFRTAAEKVADIDFSVDGTKISIPSGGVTGVPSLDSPAKISGALGVTSEGTTNLAAAIDLSSAVFTVKAFEPEFLCTLYTGVLGNIRNFSVGMEATVTKSLELDLSVSSDADAAIAAALKSSAAGFVEQVKDEVRERAEAYIADLTEQYSSEIETFTSSISEIQERFASVENIEDMADTMLAELEARAKEIAAEKAAEALSPVKDSVGDALKQATGGIPGIGGSGASSGSSSGGSSADSASGTSDSDRKTEAANNLREGLKKLF